MSFGAVCFCSFACDLSYTELSEVSLNICFMFFFYSCIYRDTQSGSRGRWDVVAGQHQSNRLLQSKLRPSQLETADSAADDQPNGTAPTMPFFHLSQSIIFPFWEFPLIFRSPFCHDSSFSSFSSSFPSILHVSCCIINVSAVLHRQIISVGNRAGLIDDVFNLARWVLFVTHRVIQSLKPAIQSHLTSFTPTETRWTIQSHSALFVCCFLLSQ